MRKKKKESGEQKAPVRQAQVPKYGFPHFTPDLMNLTVVFYRPTGIQTQGKDSFSRCGDRKVI